MAGWRGLGFFWATALAILFAGTIALQLAGPVERPPSVARQARSPAPAPEAAQKAVVAVKPGAAAVVRPGRDTPGPIADPDPALLEPAPGAPNQMLPRISADGRKPMQLYAAGFDNSSRRPRVGLIIAGIGLDQTASMRAVRDLPGPVTLAVSPYSSNLQKLLEAARLAEHEYLLSIPMEPQGFPQNDPGPQALMTTAPSPENLRRLDWVLSRIGGYAGTTGALGAMRGQRFAGISDQMNPVLAVLAKRGLFYVDPRPGHSPLPLVWNSAINLVVDEPVAEIDARLAELERIAREKGSALGLASAPRPTTLQHIAAWANGVTERGLVLAPASALMQAPASDSGN